MQNRREFIKTTACALGAIAVGGGQSSAMSLTPEPKKHKLKEGAFMHGFVAPKLDTIRVAVIGVGGRGSDAVQRLCAVPGVKVTALCELVEAKAAAQKNWMEQKGYGLPKLFIGPEAYKELSDSGICDVVHINTTWITHAPIAIYAMKAGLHTMVEVPGCRTVDEAWEMVEASEKSRVHCMLLANCCYDEQAILMRNMARKKVFDELYHAEGCYLHETRCTWGGQSYLTAETMFPSMEALIDHTGASYPLHAVGPVSLALNINRGDCFDYLVSMGSKGFGWQEFARRVYGDDAPVAKIHIEANDFNSMLISTKNGKTILIRQCNNCPMPYSRQYTLYGFKGTITANPLQIALEKEINTGAKWMNEDELAVIRSEYGAKLWQQAGEIARKKGGHGGMDYLMDLRWTYCLRNGLPLDTTVYDLAAWSSLIELSEKSVRNRSQAQTIPDFTRGLWKTTEPCNEWIIDQKYIEKI
ncbi:MAG: Gfo/Idh/MocA family oxidoreductase [Bacteroidaceae bacterium]|nr:Gfo/Idh/MocA family oxidoreductase [Bacteroidaceae bacterium]